MDLKVVSVILLYFCVCSFFLSIGHFYHSYQIEEGGHKPEVGLYTLNCISFGHQKEADINFLVPVLKFLVKKTNMGPTGSINIIHGQGWGLWIWWLVVWCHCNHIDDGVEEGVWQNKVSVSTVKYFNPSLTWWKCERMKMRLRKVGGPRLVRELEVDSRFPECQACVLLFNRRLPSTHYVPELLLSGDQGGYNSEQPWKFLSSLFRSNRLSSDHPSSKEPSFLFLLF